MFLVNRLKSVVGIPEWSLGLSCYKPSGDETSREDAPRVELTVCTKPTVCFRPTPLTSPPPLASVLSGNRLLQIPQERCQAPGGTVGSRTRASPAAVSHFSLMS